MRSAGCKVVWVIVLLCVLLTFCGCAVKAFAENEGMRVVEYGVGSWTVAGRGNHRALVKVDKCGRKSWKGEAPAEPNLSANCKVGKSGRIGLTRGSPSQKLIGLPLISTFSRDGVGGISVDAAFYRPDRGTPFAWSEGAKGIEHFHREHYRASGLVEVYLRNNGKEPVSVERLLVNGNDVTEPVKGSDIVWWRLRPNPVPAKGFGELLVRMREAPKETIALEVQTSDKKTLHLKIQPTPTPVRIESLAFDEEGKQIFAFLELVSDDRQRITRVWLDGKDVTERTRILSPNFWQNVCPIVISAPNWLTFGSFHYLRVDTDKRHKAAILFRARNDFFPLGSYGYVTPKDYASNNCNLYFCFGAMRTH